MVVATVLRVVPHRTALVVGRRPTASGLPDADTARTRCADRHPSVPECDARHVAGDRTAEREVPGDRRAVPIVANRGESLPVTRRDEQFGGVVGVEVAGDRAVEDP